MDFLDPRKKRAHRIRLMIGYVLISIVIAMGTVILVYEAYGYGVDRSTGEIIQNGLVFISSKPGPASIYLNGKLQTTRTDARMVLPTGDYDIKLARSGYRDWERQFTLEAGSIERYIYPLLFPTKLNPKTLHQYQEGQPRVVTESPDRHWLVVEVPTTAPGFSFDVYDTSRTDFPHDSFGLPAELLTAPSKAESSYKAIEWSTDNKHLLIEHDYASSKEFVMIDREVPSRSYNLNKLMDISPTQVVMHDKKFDQLYVYTASDQSLRQVNTKDKTVTQPILSKVLAFKPYGADLISYVTDDGTDVGRAQAKIWDSGNSYPLYEMPLGKVYLLDIAKFDGDWYYVAGSDNEERVNVYKNPLDTLKSNNLANKTALPVFALRLKGSQEVSFSDNARFVGITDGANFVTYDFEADKYFHFSVEKPITGLMHWMDGHRFIGVSSGVVLVMDYDGTNQQLLTPTVIPTGAYFDRDYYEMFVLSPNTSGANNTLNNQAYSLKRVELRAGNDIPAALR